MSMHPLAYFLTWRTYGTWLPGDERGFVDGSHNGYGERFRGADERLSEAAQGLMSQEPFVMDGSIRGLVDAAIRTHCAGRDWSVVALNVRTNHVHLVVGTDEDPSLVLQRLKSAATKSLRESRIVRPDRRVWSRGGSKRFLWDDEAVTAAADYVLNRQ